MEAFFAELIKILKVIQNIRFKKQLTTLIRCNFTIVFCTFSKEICIFFPIKIFNNYEFNLLYVFVSIFALKGRREKMYLNFYLPVVMFFELFRFDLYIWQPFRTVK